MKERKLTRLKDYNYSQSGYYFVTVCTQRRNEWFGEIADREMILNKNGEIAKTLWDEVPMHFKLAEMDKFVVMPNHIRGIVIIQVGNAYMCSHQRNAFMHSLQDKTKMLLSKIIQQYKASVTRKINSLQNDLHFRWQRSFYDHVIRNDSELYRIREYIQNNPVKWELDIENIRSGAIRSSQKSCKDYYKEIMHGR